MPASSSRRMVLRPRARKARSWAGAPPREPTARRGTGQSRGSSGPALAVSGERPSMAITSGYRRDPGPTPVVGGIHPRPDVEQALTERELDVLRLIGRGATNTEIGQELYIRERNVKTPVGR